MRRFHCRSKPRRQPAGQGTGSLDADLLPENGAHRKFKPVPRTRHTETGSPNDQFAEQGIGDKMGGDRGRIRIQVEKSAQPREDRAEQGREVRGYGRDERIFPGWPSHGDPAVSSSNRNRSQVGSILDALYSLDRSGCKEGQQLIPGERWTVGEAERDGIGVLQQFASDAGYNPLPHIAASAR